MHLNFIPVSNLKPANGYGKLEIALWSALAALGVTVAPLGAIRRDGALHLSEKARQQCRLSAGIGPVTLVIGRPELGDDYRTEDTRRVLYTMSESTRVSEEWVADINRLYDAVIVPAPGLVEVYINSGVRIPVHFVPMGITTPTQAITNWRDFSINGETTFLTYSLGEMRKGAELVIFAFKRLFNGKSNFKLKIKAPVNPPTWLDGCQEDQIDVIKRNMSELEWFEWLASGAAFIFPSRGEGFGLPPREATLAGTPTAATQWLGLWDVDQWGFAIPVKEMRPAPFEGAANHREAEWSEPDVDAICSIMEHIACHPSSAAQRVEVGQVHLKTFTWQRTAAGILEVINGL